MRVLFLLLILGNVGLAGLVWLDVSDRAEVGQAPTTPAGDLVLLTDPQGLRGLCLVSAPFDREVDAQVAMFRLTVPHRLTTISEQREDGWRVHLPASGNLAEARQALLTLREAGAATAALVPHDEMPYTVSISVHQQARQAEAAMERFRALGFDARVSPRLREEPRFHLVLQGDVPPSHLAHLGWTTRDCADALP